MRDCKRMARYVPYIANGRKSVLAQCNSKARECYGDNLPKEVAERLARELGQIQKHDTWMHFYVAEKLVKQAAEKGYPVGVRGTVAASFVAYLLGITQINPLSGHYLCSCCRYSEFFSVYDSYCGYDLPDKRCPVCGQWLQKEGMNLSAETFFGFEGDKEPDINLSIPKEYQQELQDHLKEIFGAGNVVTAIYLQEFDWQEAQNRLDAYQHKHKTVLSAQENALVLDVLENMEDICALRRDEYFIIPPGMELQETGLIYRVDEDRVVCFDREMMNDCFYKLDIVPSYAQTILYRLQEATKINADDIPMDDKYVTELFEEGRIYKGFPYERDEAQEILTKIKPKSISELIKAEGLLHGTGVWEENGQWLLEERQVALKDIIAARDDVYFALLGKQMEAKAAYQIMEITRKGRMHKDRRNESAEKGLQIMRECEVEEWYIESMEKVRYLFPKAHSCAYAIQNYRLLWYQRHFPNEYEESIKNMIL